MKFLALTAALLSFSNAEKLNPSEAKTDAAAPTKLWYDPFNILGSKTSEEKKEDLLWALDGLKGCYDGYYSSFYKTNRSPNMKECLDTEILTKIVDFEDLIQNPMSLVTDFNITKDMGYFGSGTEIMADLVKCNF